MRPIEFGESKLTYTCTTTELHPHKDMGIWVNATFNHECRMALPPLLNVSAVPAPLRGDLLFRIVAGDAPYQLPTPAAAPPQWLQGRGPQRHVPHTCHLLRRVTLLANCMPCHVRLCMSPHHKLLCHVWPVRLRWWFVSNGDDCALWLLWVVRWVSCEETRLPRTPACPFEKKCHLTVVCVCKCKSQDTYTSTCEQRPGALGRDCKQIVKIKQPSGSIVSGTTTTKGNSGHIYD